MEKTSQAGSGRVAAIRASVVGRKPERVQNGPSRVPPTN